MGRLGYYSKLIGQAPQESDPKIILLTVHQPNERAPVRITGKPMFTLTLSRWFGNPGEKNPVPLTIPQYESSKITVFVCGKKYDPKI